MNNVLGTYYMACSATAYNCEKFVLISTDRTVCFGNVLDMCKPVQFADLTKNMIRLSGWKPGQDIQIIYTGLRPGEKLYEERFMDEEGLPIIEYRSKRAELQKR